MLLWMPFTAYSIELSPFYEPNIGAESQTISAKDTSFQVTIEPRHRTTLSAEVASPVVTVNKKMGESFKKGDLLIQLKDILFQSNLKKAEAAQEKTRVELAAKKQLYSDRVVSLFELKEAESNAAAAQADLALAKRNLESTTIFAPYDGKVISVDVEVYETPQLGKSLIEVVDDNLLIARFLVPSSFLPKLQVGMPFEISIRETGEKIPVKVSRIGSIIDPSSGTVKVEADIDNKEGKYRSGMSGRALF